MMKTHFQYINNTFLYDQALVILMNALLSSYTFQSCPNNEFLKIYTLFAFLLFPIYLLSEKKVCPAAPKQRRENFSILFTQLFPAPKNGWNKKHKQIPKKAMKLNLNHQMSGMLGSTCRFITP